MTSPRLLVLAVALHPRFLRREHTQKVAGHSMYEYPLSTRHFLPLPVGMYAAVIVPPTKLQLEGEVKFM